MSGDASRSAVGIGRARPREEVLTEAEVLDLRGLKCPLPVFYTRRLLRRLPVGATAVVLCTDPLAVIDIPHLLRETGNGLLASEREGDSLRFVVRRDA